MWTRRELKDRAKVTLKSSYWKVVLVSLILMLVSGGIGAGSSYRFGEAGGTRDSHKESIMDNQVNDDGDFDQDYEVHNKISTKGAIYIAGFVIIGLVIFLVIFAVALTLAAFIINPLEIGIRRFFAHELQESTQIRELAFAYDHSYMNVVKTMFFRDLYTILWSLLLIIPGIIKAYEYRMIPYLLGDNPQLSMEEAFAKSKEMMDGQKWNTFVLDLSFIGWSILCMLTLGILNIFYVGPYVNLTNAALYNSLSGKNDAAETVYSALEE